MTAELPHFARRFVNAALELLFPQRCAGCGKLGEVWCQECDHRLIKIRGRLCPSCGRRQASARPCPDCRVHPLPLRVRSYAMYEGPLLRALLHMKYRPNQRLADVFANWLRDLLRRENWNPTKITAVPLAASRQRQRGYNQAGLIATALSKKTELPYDPGALRRIHETPSQVGLDPGERWLNVSGAFEACSHNEQGHAVLLVDDLFTTGATLAACASALLEKGVDQVFGLTVARAR